MVERSNPTARHEVVDGQETPSRPTADEGTVTARSTSARRQWS